MQSTPEASAGNPATLATNPATRQPVTHRQLEAEDADAVSDTQTLVLYMRDPSRLGFTSEIS